MFTEYITKESDRWDLIAWAAYGDVSKMPEIIAANPKVPVYDVLPSGIKLLIPVSSLPPGDDLSLPPWKRNGANTTVTEQPVYQVVVNASTGGGYVRIYKPDGVTPYAIAPAGSIYILPITNNVMIKKYASQDSTYMVLGEPEARIFPALIGFPLENLAFAITGVGFLGDLDSLTADAKIVVSWEPTTGKVVFSGEPGEDTEIVIIAQSTI